MKPILLFFGLLFITTVQAQPMKLTQAIRLPGVEGRIDHMSLDAAGRRLFVAALGNNTVEVVDLKAGKVARSLAGFLEPQGVLFLPEFNRLYVANGGDGAVRVIDAKTFETVTRLKFEDDADNLRYDAPARQVYVGYGSGGLGIIDADKDRIVSSIPLSAHPESFQFEKDDTRIFVNIPRSHTVAVVDRASRSVTGHWSLGNAASNFPMAVDDAGRRVFVATRSPARLLVFDMSSGKEVANLDLHGDCDDVFFDPARQQIYASCGEGYLDVFGAMDGDYYFRKAAVPTVAKARTCFFDGNNIYLAVPKRGSDDAQIQSYAILP